MQVTDEMVDIFTFKMEYLKNPVWDIKVCAALEAVFDHIRDATKKVENKVIKDFVDIRDKAAALISWINEDSHITSGYHTNLINSKEYKALKASISPVSEYKKEEWILN